MIGLYFYLNKSNTNGTNTATNIYQKFNPFGTGTSKNTNNTTDTNIVNNNTGGDTNAPSVPTSRFHKITSFAVSGAAFFEDIRPIQPKESTDVTATTVTVNNTTTSPNNTTQKNIPPIVPTTETVPALRYVERATGHIYQMYLDTKVEGKISNSTIPGVYEAIFDGKATSVIYRYVSTDNKSITSFLATLGGKSDFLSSDIAAISLSKDKSKFFSLIDNKNGVIGVIKSFGDTKSNQVFSSSFSEWLPQWVTDQSIYLTTKPSYLVEGDVFNLNTTNGTLSKIFGGIKGLTTLANNDGSYVLYGASLDIGPKLNVFDVKNHKSLDLEKYGLPEKCVWSNDNINVYCAIPNTVIGTEYPDSWYQGTTSFDDWFVKINTVTKASITIANSLTETPIDGTNLFLSDKEDQLFFINKKDSTLWSLDL